MGEPSLGTAEGYNNAQTLDNLSAAQEKLNTFQNTFQMAAEALCSCSRWSKPISQSTVTKCTGGQQQIDRQYGTNKFE